MAKLEVQHFVLTKFTRQYGRPLASDLHHVCGFQTVPGQVEFPCPSGQMELFVRFFATDLPPTRFKVTIDWDGGRTSRRVFRAFGDVNTVEVEGTAVIDRTYKLVRLTYPGEGVYTIRVWGPHHSWRGNRWRRLATEYIWLGRSP
jgi:hypothetical protein